MEIQKWEQVGNKTKGLIMKNIFVIYVLIKMRPKMKMAKFQTKTKSRFIRNQ